MMRFTILRGALNGIAAEINDGQDGEVVRVTDDDNGTATVTRRNDAGEFVPVGSYTMDDKDIYRALYALDEILQDHA